MNIHLKLLLLLLFSIYLYNPLLCQTSDAATTVYYVDPANGNDSNDGLTVSSAFASIAKARDAVRLVNQTMTEDITIYLRGGNYYIQQPVYLETNDSGFNGFNIIYKAYEDEKPVISGGQIITGWTLHDGSKNIYKVSFNSTVDFRQLYVNGKRAIRARIPNLADTTTFAGYYTAVSTDPFVVQTSDVGSWSNLNQVECVWISHWHEKRARISSIENNDEESTITLMQPEKDSPVIPHAQNDTYGRLNYYYYENAYEFLDAEGEWYLDKNNSILYYIPRSDEDMISAETVIPVSPYIFNIGGAEGNVHNIQFYGLTFECTNWTEPNDYGYINWQAGMQLQTNNDSVIPGMIQIENADNLRFERNVFRRSGSHGLVTSRNTHDVTIIGNKFTDLAGGGIYINSDYAIGTSSFDIVSNNVVENIGKVYTDCVGILATNVNNMKIVHNMVSVCPYTGISIGWSWDDLDKGSANNDVSYNRVDNVLQLHDDGAGIYTLGRMPGGMFTNNYISNIVPSPYHGGYAFSGIYLDNGSCYKTVENNVLDNTFSAFCACNAPNYDNEIRNNFLNTNYGDVATTNNTSNNKFYRNSDWPPEALSIMSNAGVEQEYEDLISNASVGYLLPNQFSLSQNYPNPFNPSTTIEYELQRRASVKLEIFDVLGKKVSVLVDEIKSPGKYKVLYNCCHMSSGVYFFRLKADNFIQTNKMILVK